MQKKLTKLINLHKKLIWHIRSGSCDLMHPLSSSPKEIQITSWEHMFLAQKWTAKGVNLEGLDYNQVWFLLSSFCFLQPETYQAHRDLDESLSPQCAHQMLTFPGYKLKLQPNGYTRREFKGATKTPSAGNCKCPPLAVLISHPRNYCS